jgi:hypothetical protein
MWSAWRFWNRLQSGSELRFSWVSQVWTVLLDLFSGSDETSG